MKKNIELEKCLFIGSSDENRALYTKADGTEIKCSQTDIIKALSKSKRYIQGGKKIKLDGDSKKVSYLIDYGAIENEPKQMIKITFDAQNLRKGDVNALAVDSICNHSIVVKNNNMKKKVLSGIKTTLVTVSITGALVAGYLFASEKEALNRALETQKYIEELNDYRIENGQDPIMERQEDNQEFTIDEIIKRK